MGNSHVRTFLLNLALVLGGLLAGVGLMEAVLRAIDFSYVAFHRPDHRLGLRLRENADGKFRSEGAASVRINAAGFRDREHAVEKQQGTFRVAVLGDSYVEALQVELGETFPALLERRLNACGAFGAKAVEVLNFGVSGYGTAQQLLIFRHVAKMYSPDLVLSAFFSGNDVRNNSRALESDQMRPFFVLQGDALLEDDSFASSAEFARRTNWMRSIIDRLRGLRVVQAAFFVKDRLLPALTSSTPETGADAAFERGLDAAALSEPKSAAWLDAWSVTERLYAQLANEVRAAGAKLVIVTLSSGIQVHPDPDARRKFQNSNAITDIFYPDRRIELVASRAGVESVILAPQLQSMAERDQTYFHGFSNTRAGTGHWNQDGHRAAADIVAAKLCGVRQR